MKLIVLILIITLPLSFVRADEESLRVQIENLRNQLVTSENRIAQLETTTSLLMAAYQLEVKKEAYKQQQQKDK